MSDNAIEITDDNFDEIVLKADKPVLVDFWASWCRPYIVMSPIVDELATKVRREAVVVKLNVDDNPKTAESYEVMSIPTFILFKNGEAKKSAFGSMDEEKLFDTFRKWLE